MSHKGFINVGKEKVDVPFQIKNGQKSTKDIKRNSSRIQQERKERTKGKEKPYNEINREKTRHREQMGASIGSTMTTSGLALPCSVSEQELSPEGNTGYPNASDNK